jgi:hypothetical protein
VEVASLIPRPFILLWPPELGICRREGFFGLKKMLEEKQIELSPYLKIPLFFLQNSFNPNEPENVQFFPTFVK